MRIFDKWTTTAIYNHWIRLFPTEVTCKYFNTTLCGKKIWVLRSQGEHYCEITHPRSLHLFFQYILSLAWCRKQSVARSSVTIKESSKVQLNMRIHRTPLGFAGQQSTQTVTGQVLTLANRAGSAISLLQESLQQLTEWFIQPPGSSLFWPPGS